MAELNYQRMVIGYHGCDATVVAKVLADGESLAPSERNYDWLGKGVYFWEYGPQRAFDWAKEKAMRNPDQIKTPAVLGAYINLGHCFDLLDTANTELLQKIYPEFTRFTSEQGKAMPKNESVSGEPGGDRILRKLDCAVINWSLDAFGDTGRNYQTVRGVFVEGVPPIRAVGSC